MKLLDELPGPLWPFCKSEIYASVLNGAQFAFAEPPPPEAALVIDDIRGYRLELAAALRAVRRTRARPDDRQRAAIRVAELRAAIVRKHMRLRRLSIGYRASPAAPVHYWP